MNLSSIKRLATILLIVTTCFSIANAEESFYKFRIYREFVKDLFEKNLEMIFKKSEDLQIKDIRLPDLDTQMTNVSLSVQPRVKSWDNLQLEVFFDEGQIIMEMHDLEFAGNGTIIDPQSEIKERIEFHAPINTAQVVMSLG